mgnify:FL=1
MRACVRVRVCVRVAARNLIPQKWGRPARRRAAPPRDPMLLANDQNLSDGLLVREPATRPSGTRRVALGLCVASALLATAALCILARARQAPQACHLAPYEPCGRGGCCIPDTSCVARASNVSQCIPACATPLWGECELGRCCPPRSVCTPRAVGFKQCVPQLVPSGPVLFARR